MGCAIKSTTRNRQARQSGEPMKRAGFKLCILQGLLLLCAPGCVLTTTARHAVFPIPESAAPSRAGLGGPSVILASGQLPSDTLSEEDLVQQVLARNPTLAQMTAAWQAAVERIPQVTSHDDPM